MTEQPGDGTADPRTKSIMTACEVLTWIALRRAITQEQLGSLFKVSVGRWACIPADGVLEALEARAGISGDGPYCAIRWGKDPHHSDSTVYTAFSPQGPAMLRWISRQFRREIGKLLSFAALARLLREEIAADEKMSEQIEEAKAQLRDRVAGGLLVAHGISLEPDGTRSAGALVQEIAASVFMHPAMTITEWDEAHADTTKPVKEWHNQRLPRFGNIQFKTAEVLALWPPRVAISEPHSGPKPDPVLPHVAEPTAVLSEHGPGTEMEPNPWVGAVGVWEPLSTLLKTVEREFGIASDEAAKALRHPLENYEILTRIVDYNGPLSMRGPSGSDLISWHDKWNEYSVTQAGWEHVDRKAGTLRGYRIEIFWSHVARALAPLIDAEKRRRNAEAAAVVKARAAVRTDENVRTHQGRPPKHDWDAFWIEVAIYAAANDLNENYRPDLQSHLVKWAAKQWPDPPDDATIRGKLARLYKTARNRV